MAPIFSNRFTGAALVFGAGLCWSSGGILVRLISADAWSIIFWRSAFMVISVGLYLGVRHRRSTVGVVRDIGLAGLASAALLCGAFVFFILSLEHTTVANTVVLMSASPLVAAFLGHLFLREHVSRKTVAATGIALGGITIMFLGSLNTGAALGNVFALIVAFCLGSNIVVLRASRHVDMVPAMAVAGLISMAITFPLAPLGDTRVADMGLLAIMGCFQLGLGLFLVTRGTRYLSAAEVGLLTLSETVFAPIWVWIGVGETPAIVTFIGGTLVLGALAGNFVLGRQESKIPVGIA